MQKAQPSAALAAMYEIDLALGIDPLAVDNAPPLPAPPPQPGFWIEKPDWDAEDEPRAAEQERQRQERAAILEQELARIEDEEAYPATRRRRWLP